jgi:hypothetical protein
MYDKDEKKIVSSSSLYLQMALSFASAKLFSAAVRHPAHLVQVKKQADPNSSIKQIIQEVYAQKGVRGFYKAMPSSIYRILLAECYRGPLMVEIPACIRANFLDDNQFKNVKYVSNILSIPVVSTIDATLICPILKLQTHQLTSKNPNITLMQIIKHYAQSDLFDLSKQLYRGYNVVWFQTAKQWTMFFCVYDFNKYLMKKSNGNSSYSALAISSIIGGILQAAVAHVPDTIRVHMQKSDSVNKKVIPIISSLIKTHGVKGLTSGMSARLFGATAGYAYKCMLLNHFEQKREVLEKSKTVVGPKK